MYARVMFKGIHGAIAVHDVVGEICQYEFNEKDLIILDNDWMVKITDIKQNTNISVFEFSLWLYKHNDTIKLGMSTIGDTSSVEEIKYSTLERLSSETWYAKMKNKIQQISDDVSTHTQN